MKKREDMKLQNRVRELRAKHRLSQGDLGKAIGSSRQTISLIERGDYAPSIVLSLKIAQIFNVPVEEIFTLVEGKRTMKSKRKKQFDSVGKIALSMIGGFLTSYIALNLLSDEPRKLSSIHL